MRVQFSITDLEEQKLKKLADEQGYPDIPTYCKDTVLKERTYANLWEQVKNKIEIMPSGTIFLLKDLVKTPPSSLGIKLYNNQDALNIEKVKKDNSNTNVFRKK